MKIKTCCFTLFISFVIVKGIWSAESITPRLEIISLRPNKIVYNDGEVGIATVRLTNPLPQSQEVTLKGTLFWDLEESRDLSPVSLTVPAKNNASATIPLPKPPERWGYEIRVEAVVDGKTVDVGRQFFGVNSDWMDMILISFPRQVYIDNGLLMSEEPFTTYTTLQHWFAWAPADYCDNAPKVDDWISGQAGYKMNKKGIQEAVKKYQSMGIHCTFYNNSFTDGDSGWEWIRRHPDWIVRDRNGAPKGMSIDFYDPKVIEWGARNTIESIKMFGWDGMFWDCGGCCLFPGFSYDGQPTPHGKDPDQLSARNHRMFRELVRKEYPHFGIWINGDINYYKGSFWNAYGNGGGVPTYEDQMSATNSAMLAEFRFHEDPGTPFHNWRRCYDAYSEQRDAVTQRFGTPVAAGYTVPWAWTAESHLGALLLATQMHPCNCHQAGTWPMTQFMTRYSALLWRRDVKVIPNPESLFSVETTRPVWWNKTVYRRPTSKGEDLMLHLVNTPETEDVDAKRSVNPPATSGKVTLLLPLSKKLRSVYALQPRQGPSADRWWGMGLDVGGAPARMTLDTDGKTWVHNSGSLCRTGPSQVELKPVMDGNRITVEVPEFVYHTMVVFRLEK